MGPIFCQVIIIKFLDHFNPLITSGSQKWNGAAPIFRRRDEDINAICIGLSLISKGSLFFSKIMIVNKIKDDPVAWAIKYLIVLSEGNLLLLFFNRGIKDKRLISKPIQAVIHECAEIAIKVPIIVELINKILYILMIKKKRIDTFISGVWTQ